MIGDFLAGHTFFPKNAMDEQVAGLRPAGPHPGAGHDFEFVHIAIALADEVTDLSSGDPFTPADDRIVRDMLHILIHRLGKVFLLNADAGDPVGKFDWGPRSVIKIVRSKAATEAVVFYLQKCLTQPPLYPRRHPIPRMDRFPAEFIRYGHLGQAGIFPAIDQGDGQPRAACDAAPAGFARILGSGIGRHVADIGFVDKN